MKTRFNKLTAWLLTLAMLMTLVPGMTFTAFAAAGTVASVTTEGGETSYHTTIGEAVNAAKTAENSTLKLLDNITTDSETYIDIKSGSFTIDLNGKTWTSYTGLNIWDTTDIKIIDSSATGTGKLLGTGGGAPTICLVGSTKLEIAGGTVEHNNYTDAVNMSYGGHLTQAELIVSGGKLITNGATAIFASGSLVKITGGTFESSRSDIYYKNGVIDLTEHKDPKGITIYTYTMVDASAFDTTIKLPEGYVMLDKDGNAVNYFEKLWETYTVGEPGTYVASVTTASGGTSYHADITSAVNKAKQNSGSILKLLDNINTESTVAISGSFTLDLGGKTWTIVTGVLISNNADIKIIDSSAAGTDNGTGMLVGSYVYSPILLDGNAKLEIAGGTVESWNREYAVDMSFNGNTTSAELIVSGGKLSTNGSRAIGAFGSSVKVTGGTFESTGETIYYSTGVIDLSGHTNPTDITIYNGTGAEVIVSDSTIKRPEGYAMLDSTGNAVNSLEVNGSYTVGKCNHGGDNVIYNNGFCACGSYESAVLKGDAYEISNAGQLFWFANEVNIEGDTDANAILTADIDLEGYKWTPIGVTAMGESVTGGYTGSFDGNGHVIRNVTFDAPTSAMAAGVFGTVQSGGTVKHLGVENLIFDNDTYDHRAGGIAGQLLADSTISDCYVVNSTVKASTRVVGGIVGMNKGTVENCYTYNMTLAGYNNRFGGISGDYTGGTLKNCYTNHSALASSQTGANENCEAGVSAERFASGEITYNLNNPVSDGELVWYQTIGTDSIPKFAGSTVYKVSCEGVEFYSNENESYDTHNFAEGFCSHCGEITPAEENNGIYEIFNVGQYIWFAKFVNEGNPAANAKLMADIDLSKHGNVMIGTSSAKYSGSFDGNGKNLTVNFNTTEQYVAPFRYIDGATIQNLTVDGTIATSAKFAAGVVGSGYGNSKIEKCMVGVTINSGVNGDGTHGGLVAVVESGSMTIGNCGFIGSITGNTTDSCGGFVGWANGTTTIKNSYIYGTFTTGTNGCNTFGRNPNNITVSDSYYETTYGTNNTGATQKSADQFASGEVAYLLGEAWGQRIGAEKYPVLGGDKVLFANDVYYNEIADFAITAFDADTKTATIIIPTSGTYTVIFADYDGERLANTELVPVTVTEAKTETTTITKDFNLGKDDKIMLWQDMTDCVPLCDTYIVK